MNNDSFLEAIFFIVIIGLAIGFAGWGMGQLVVPFHDRILMPSIHFITFFFETYGRGFGEVCALITIAWIGYKIGNQVANTFKDVVLKIDAELEQCKEALAKVTNEADRHLESRKNIVQESKALHAENRTLKDQVKTLEEKIERILAPEVVKKREEEMEKRESNAALLELVKDTNWRLE